MMKILHSTTLLLVLLTGVILAQADLVEKIVSNPKSDTIVDARMSFQDAIRGTKAPKKLIGRLVKVDVEYYSLDGNIHRGQVVVDSTLAADIREVFLEMKRAHFPVRTAIPIVCFDWSDSLSMLANNTSAFNYRVVKGTSRMSMHSSGRALDINPRLNPWVCGRDTSPVGAQYDRKARGTISDSSIVVRTFKKLGWRWGGDWKRTKDYQHFEK